MVTAAEELPAAFTNVIISGVLQEDRSFVIGRKENSHVYKAQQVKMSITERFVSHDLAMVLTNLFLTRENKFKS